MPYPNEHAARQRSPANYNRFARNHPKGWPAGVDAILGVRSDGKSEIQSVRFDSGKWTPAAARAWLKTHGMSSAGFEQATGKAHPASVGPNSGQPLAAPSRFDVDGVVPTDDGKMVKLRFTVYKIDQYERKIFGWLYICREAGAPEQTVDHSGEVVGIKTLEAASYKYVHEHRKMGDMHRRKSNGEVVVCGHLIECAVYTPEKRAAMAESLGLARDTFEKLIPDGMWVGYQITDPETWADILSGKKRALSFGGRARKVPLAQGATQ